MKKISRKQKRVMNEMKIDCEKVANEIVDFLQSYFAKSKKKKAIIGLSGGIDSAIVAALCEKALGRENVIVVKLPYKSSWCQESIRDADLVVENLDLLSENVHLEYINEVVDAIAKGETDKIIRGNIMARVRMIFLYKYPKNEGLVIGTSNKSELLLGYFTRWGDGAADLEPIGDLYKTQVFQLARYLNIPERIIEKIPTADLWQGQTDEGEIGCPYSLLDTLLFLTFDKGICKKELLTYGYKEKDIDAIIGRVKVNEFKRNPIPACKLN